MEDFITKTTYTESDILDLINTQAEESVHLDFKASGALEKTDEKRTELAKDVSAFANSDGGIIIYGINENNHVASSLSFVDGNIFTKEWIERIINNGIQKRIHGIEIFPIRFDGDINKTVYVIRIPRSSDSPHMCVKKHIYYRRFNFESVPMEEYEVRDSFNRVAAPDLGISSIAFKRIKDDANIVTYELSASVVNKGHQVCEAYKMNFYINNLFLIHNLSYRPLEVKHSFIPIDNNRAKISSPSVEPIYSKEELSIGHINILVKKEFCELFEKHLVIDMILFFGNRTEELAYSYYEDKFIETREEIDNAIAEKVVKESDLGHEPIKGELPMT